MKIILLLMIFTLTGCGIHHNARLCEEYGEIHSIKTRYFYGHVGCYIENGEGGWKLLEEGED